MADREIPNSTCSICKEPYTTDTLANDKSKLPVQSHVCGHMFCFGCLQDQHAVKLAYSRSNNVKWIKCSLCQRENAFQVVDPIFSFVVCGMLEEVRKVQEQNNDEESSLSSATESNNNDDIDSNVPELQQISPDPVDSLMTTQVSHEHENPSSTMTADRNNSSSSSSSSSTLPIPEAIGSTTISEETLSSEEEESTAAESNNEQEESPGRVATRGNRESMMVSKVECEPSPRRPPSWQECLSKPGTRLYRIRIFKNDAKVKNGDKYGKLPAHWCLRESVIASCARVLPRAIRTSQAARAHLLSRPVEAVMLDCKSAELRPYFKDNIVKKTLKLYCNGYRKFAAMKSGDVVAMMVKEGANETLMYFGVITSQDIVIKSKTQLRAMDFPSPHLFENVEQFKCDRLMLREVRWMKMCSYQRLQEETDKAAHHWFLVPSPFWLADVTERKDPTTKRKGLDGLAADNYGLVSL